MVFRISQENRHKDIGDKMNEDIFHVYVPGSDERRWGRRIASCPTRVDADTVAEALSICGLEAWVEEE